MEGGDAFSYGAICTTTDLLSLAVEIISPNDRRERLGENAEPLVG